MVRSTVLCLAVFMTSFSARADEGMWTLDNFPTQRVKQVYGVELTDDWMRKVQRATVRLGGCTGSFVSPDGLILTNNHCVWSCMRDLSSKERNLAETGFVAATLRDEARCRSETVSVLVGSYEITREVIAAVKGKSAEEAHQARKKKLTELEKSCEDDSDEIKCESVTLYQGGQYFIYKYKRYDDVRLAFAPELGIAAFGGDPDNFNFPRWSLDYSFLRVYANDKPAETPSYLRWRADGARAGEAVFISGHPGKTERLRTVSQLRFQRDYALPRWLLRASELRGRMLQWAKTGDEPRRIINERILSLENRIKVRRNRLFALLDDAQFARKANEERALKSRIEADPRLRSRYGDAWGSVERAMEAYATFYDRKVFVADAVALDSTLYRAARTLVRAAAERTKPNAERLREYRDTALARLEQLVTAPRPVYPGYEVLRLSYALEKAVEWLGPDDPFVRRLLVGRSPQDLAEELVRGSKLADPAVRRALWDGGQAAVGASHDPMVKLAIALDGEARALRTRYEKEVEAIADAAAEKIAAARFAVYGTSLYPDATFTLRVTYGAVRGWKEKGKKVEPFTKLSRLFERATGKAPFKLPDRWKKARGRLPADMPFNYVATTDIIGGNSGSPMLDQHGNLVGLAFDGNIHSIPGAYWFDESKNRTVVVHPKAMLTALEDVYGAHRIRKELTVHAPSAPGGGGPGTGAATR